MSYANRVLECLENRGLETIETIEYTIPNGLFTEDTVKRVKYKKGVTRFSEKIPVPIKSVKIYTSDKFIVVVSKNGNNKPDIGLENAGFRGSIETEMSLIRQLKEYGNLKEIL